MKDVQSELGAWTWDYGGASVIGNDMSYSLAQEVRGRIGNKTNGRQKVKGAARMICENIDIDIATNHARVN